MRVLIVERRGADTARVILALDGKPEPRAIAVGRSAGATASTVSKWDKNRLTTTVTLANGATGPVQYEEVRYLEQGSLIVEIRQVGSPNARRVVYTREK